MALDRPMNSVFLKGRFEKIHIAEGGSGGGLFCIFAFRLCMNNLNGFQVGGRFSFACQRELKKGPTGNGGGQVQ